MIVGDPNLTESSLRLNGACAVVTGGARYPSIRASGTLSGVRRTRADWRVIGVGIRLPTRFVAAVRSCWEGDRDGVLGRSGATGQ